MTQISQAKNFVEELLHANVISQNVADDIYAYYKTNSSSDAKNNVVIMLFSLLGAGLITTGIILIFAHNWDNLPKWSKIGLAFTPLIISQALALFALVRRKSTIWIETTALLICGSIGATIALVSQMYHIPGDFDAFMLVWILLVLPIIYVMRAQVVSMAYLIMLLLFTLTSSDVHSFFDIPYNLFWPLVLLIASLPFYISRLKLTDLTILNAVIKYIYDWLVAIIILIIWYRGCEYLLPPHLENTTIEIFSYAFLFALFYMLSKTKYFNSEIAFAKNLAPNFFVNLLVFTRKMVNAYTYTAFFGTLIIMAIFSYSHIWDSNADKIELESSIIIAIMLAIGGVIFYLYQKTRQFSKINPLAYGFMLLGVLLLSSIFTDYIMAYVFLVNAMILAWGLWYIHRGYEVESIYKMNVGLIVIALLILLRFADLDLSFITKGLIFIALGLMFFGINILIVKRWRRNAPKN